MLQRLGAAGVVATGLLARSAGAQQIEITGPLVAVERVEEVSIHATAPARSASDWEVDRETLVTSPHEGGADVLQTAPACS
jgi:hypothetical protein